MLNDKQIIFLLKSIIMGIKILEIITQIGLKHVG